VNLEKWSDDKIAARIDLVEWMITREADWKKLPPLNAAFNALIGEQVRRDLERAGK